MPPVNNTVSGFVPNAPSANEVWIAIAFIAAAMLGVHYLGARRMTR